MSPRQKSLSGPGRDERGMASVAVLIFSIVAVLILVANFKLNYAVSVSGDAFDTFNSQMVEKNGVAQVVKESILALRETAVVNSGNSIQAEIQNRLANLGFPAGVSLTLQASANVPAHPFFPFVSPFVPAVSPLALAQPAYFSTSPRGLAGMGGLFSSLAIQGPVTDMGTLVYTFARSSTQAPGEDWTYTVNANLFSVPLTNVDFVAYGLPSSGLISAQAPSLPPGTLGSGVSALVVTSNNPATDPTAYPDLFAPAGQEQLPYQFRNAASFSWNAYEYLWNLGYQDALMNAAKAEADPGNQAVSVIDLTPPAGALYDFSRPAFDPANPGNYPCNPTIAGLSSSGFTLTVDCSAVHSQVIAIVDAEGVGTVNITGSPSSGAPFVLLIRNTAGNLGRTNVVFSGNNSCPAIFYLENANVTFAGSPQIEGALFLDPTTVAAGNVTWFGHFSFYGPASPLGTLSIAMNDDPAVKAALAGLAPRVLLVSTTATRQ